MNPQSVALVKQSWAKVKPISAVAADLFYNNLFEADPSLRPMFRGDMKQQGEKLMQMLDAAVSKLDKPNVLIPVLEDLGRRHVSYGVKDAHYQTVGAAFIKTLSQGLGAEFTEPVKNAWIEIYTTMANVMTSAK